MPRRLIARRPDVSPCTTWGRGRSGSPPRTPRGDQASGRQRKRDAPSSMVNPRRTVHKAAEVPSTVPERGSARRGRPLPAPGAHRPSWCTALRAVRGVCALGVIDLEACAGLFSLGPIEAYDVTHASVCGRSGGFRACAGRVPSVRCRGRSAVHPCRALDVVERWCGQARSLLPTMRRTCVPRSHSADTRQLDGLRRSGGLGQPLTTSARLSSDST